MFENKKDMNGFQRETQNHVEDELEWGSGYFIINCSVDLLSLVVQVASSDYKLFKAVLTEAKEVN